MSIYIYIIYIYTSTCIYMSVYFALPCSLFRSTPGQARGVVWHNGYVHV